jgi:hypothetical protein
MMKKSKIISIIEEISHLKDHSNLKDLASKLKDAIESDPNYNPCMEDMVKKWAKKLEPLHEPEFNNNDIKNVAVMLTNQYKHLNSIFVENFDKEIDILKKQLDSLNGEAKTILEKAIKEKEDNKPTPYYDTYLWRGVNVYDEIVKMYDAMQMRKVVGIQPMTFPVGLAYGLRFKKMEDNNIGLTIENKEIKTNTEVLSYSNNEKVSGIKLANFLDMYIYQQILNLKPSKKISKDSIGTECLKAKKKNSKIYKNQ